MRGEEDRRCNGVMVMMMMVVVVEVGSEEAQESSYFFAGEGDNENTCGEMR